MPASGNLPLALSSFVGRDGELAVLAPLLAGERLVTLTGPGGSGKTRLALEAARREASRWPQGVWLVDLAPLRDAALLAQTIATALGVREQGDTPFIFTLIEWLQPRRILLLLDNCEHLVEASAEVVERLLRVCSGLTILATSREALGITGEMVRAVPALALAARDTTDTAAVASSEAAQLFVARSAAQQAGFALTDANAAAVARICRRLDGLPLAIELAAARTSLLAPAQIAERLEASFDLLSAIDRAAPPRHRTLRAAIDWSFNLLTPEEQRCFSRLSVFAGSFDLDSAEAVSRGSGQSITSDFLDLIGRLAAQSLVTTVENAGAVRLRLLETLRGYGREQLRARGELEAVLRSHAEYFMTLAAQAEPALEGADQAAWLARLDRHHDDLRAALRFLDERGEHEAALQLAVSIRRFWEIRGHLSEGIGWLLRLLNQGTRVAPLVRSWALGSVGFLSWRQGDPARALPLLEESVAISRALGATSGVGRCLLEIGSAFQAQKEMERAKPYFEEALDIFRELDDALNAGRTLTYLSVVACAQGRLDAALACAQQGIGLHEQTGNHHGRAIALSHLSEILYARGEPAAAYARAEQALAIFASLGDERLMGAVLNNLALIAVARGRYEQACDHAEAALRVLEPADERLGVAVAHERLALVAAHVGTAATSVAGNDRRRDIPAAEHLRVALLLKRTLGYPVELAIGVETAMQIAVLRGHWPLAARLYGAAQALREAACQPLSPYVQSEYERAFAPARHTLGTATFEAACAAGRALTLDEAIGEALAGDAASGTPGVADEATAQHASPFTEREAQVIRLLVSGRSNKEIARALLMSVRTVERHITNAYGKIGAAGRSDAISYVLHHGL